MVLVQVCLKAFPSIEDPITVFALNAVLVGGFWLFSEGRLKFDGLRLIPLLFFFYLGGALLSSFIVASRQQKTNALKVWSKTLKKHHTVILLD